MQALVWVAALGLSAAPLWQEKAKTAAPLVALPDFRALAKESLPAVVNITVEQKVKLSSANPHRGPHFGQDPEDFFERFFGQRMPREFKNRGIGTGFVISADGYVLTNNHVVENADTIKVKFPDEVSGDEYSAKVVGTDPRTDVALIKIEAKRSFTALPLGNSSELQVGEWVVAIGNPFGLSHTVSAGIVSAKDRRDVDPGGKGGGLYDFIQTDAAINPGNSGGPLLNLRGEVIGINAAINASGQGIGFAIPINMVKAEIMDLKDKGRVSRSWIGISLQPMTSQLAKSFGLDHVQGAVVAEVVENGPGHKAGMLAGDVVLAFDGQPIRTSSDLPLLAAQAGVNKTVSIQVLREGKKRDLKVTLGEFPGSSAQVGPAGGDDDVEKGSGALGLKVSDLTQETRDRFNVKEKQGAVVFDLDPAGPAAEAGLRSGDVIVKINDKAVTNARELSKIVKGTKAGEMLRLFVKRGTGSLFVALPKP